MEGVRQAYLELTGLSSAVAASRPSGEPSGTKRRAEDALDIDRETLGSLPDNLWTISKIAEPQHRDW